MQEEDDISPSEEYDDSFRLRRLTRSHHNRLTELVRVQEIDPVTGEIKVKMKRIRRGFGDEEKIKFLEEYRKWGRMGESCQSVGFSSQTIRKALEEDEDFAAAFAEAELEYKDKLISHHQNLVFNGQVKKTYDRNGNLLSEEQVFPIRLIELELKKHDPGYREKQEVAVTHGGGVLLAPAEMASIDDWKKKFGEMKNVTPTSVSRGLPRPEEDEEEEF